MKNINMRSLYNSYRYILFCLMYCISYSTVYAQQPAGVDSLRKKFKNFREQAFQEKVYLHNDRSGYLTGETMWFKLYLTDGSFHKPSSMSDVVYVEILDKAKQPVLQTKVGMTDGKGNGSLFLPATLSSGNYIIRAYTNWMKNFSADFYFHKSISIINSFRTNEPDAKQAALPPDAQFFPEGGSLVSGIKSKIAFRVINAEGKGIAFTGALINQHNDTLTRFKPLKFGMGHFEFTPQSGQTYRAVIHESTGKTTFAKFPNVSEEGYTLSVTDSLSDAIDIHVYGAGNSPVYLFVHARQIMAHASVKYLQQGKVTFTIQKSDLPEGINHLTVFDTNMKPVAERLYFKKPENLLRLDIHTDQQQYTNRRRVKLDIQTSVATAAKSSDVSVSVYKLDSLSENNTSGIAEYFWFSSDLKGNIESPEYYNSKDALVNEAIDNLMLTHGWRRFAWSDVLNNHKPAIEFLPEYRGHIVKGIVRGPDGAPANWIMTYLASPSKITRLYGSFSNKKGEVFYEMQKFTGSANIILQTNYKQDSLYRVEIISPFSSAFASVPLAPFQLSPARGKELLDRSVAMQVQDIYYREQLDKISRPETDSSAFFGPPDEKYLLDAFTRFPVMEEVMREYVPGVMVRKRRDGFHFMVIDAVRHAIFDETPLIMLDGVPIFDEDEIMSFSPLKIRKLEVIKKRYYLGPLSFPGIVSYTSYTGDLNGFQLNPKSIRMNYDGLQTQREFYTPRYETQQQRQTRMPDQRTLLYWNPSVTTGVDGKQQLEFYTSDQAGDFQVVVEGMTNDGSVGSGRQTFSVLQHNN
ncbi:MAG TPA: hypothetical protein VIN08_14160 [Ohtaekwangia sp.]|uniref:hypothetical protein n=1 Tax=Ohtaekwangia sp. TaxID=2066019 RepID=UPI002F9320C2